MRIATFVRTFMDLEEPHIAAFLTSHSFCDTIYIGLCRTSAKTIEIASRYPNVKFREFDGVFNLADGTPVAHESQYYSFLNSWLQEEAKKGNVDFCLLDDFDHTPSPSLHRDARRIIEEINPPFVYALLMYIWGKNDYFPELNDCVPSERLWGWNVHQWTPDINPDPPFTVEIRNQPDRDIDKGYTFPHPPYCIKHFSYLTEEIVWKKMEFNAKRGVPQAYPLDSCGRLEPVPSWAKV